MAANMTHAEFEELERDFNKLPSESLQRKLLLGIRAKKLRRPELVIRCGLPLLKRGRGSLGKAELWDVREQVCLAAMELHMFAEAEEQLDALKVQEAAGFYQQASDVYEEILKEDPANAQARRRKICNLRGVGSPEALAEALKQMNEYLDLFPTDVETWRELGDMHLEFSNVELAKFAFEEVVMLAPINHVNHTVLADCLYTLGDYATARKYYAQSLELKPEGNARAAIGMVLTASAINSSRNSTAEDKANNEPLYECGKMLLLEAYDSLGTHDAGKEVGALVKRLLK